MDLNDKNKLNYDVAIIGSGPGGFSASVHLARFHKRVCIIEKDILGGTCLNTGCIPTKILVAAKSYLSQISKLSTFGINVDSCSFDYSKLKTRQEEIVKKRRDDEKQLFCNLGIDYFQGKAKFIDSHRIEVVDEDEVEQVIFAQQVLLAVGSRAMMFQGIPFDEDILDSTGVLDLQKIPKSLTIIGGGVIGCEFAQIFSSFGAKVAIVEALSSIIPDMDKDQQKILIGSLQKQGIKIILGEKVKNIKKNEENVQIFLMNGKILKSKKILICIGRKTNIDTLEIEKIGIKKNGDRIEVGEDMKTTCPTIYAVGDIVKGPQLASKGVYEGFIAAENILGFKRKNNPLSIPKCIFTDPQIASVGLNEEDILEDKIIITSSSFKKNAYADAYKKREGFVKLIIDKKDGKILGMHIAGPNAIDLIGQASFAINSSFTISQWLDIALTLPHPSYSEVLRDAIRSAYCSFIEQKDERRTTKE